MWKKIAIFQLILVVALVAFWVGNETKADEPLTRQIITYNEEGSIVYIWIYDPGSKQWNVTRLNFNQGDFREIDISLR